MNHSHWFSDVLERSSHFIPHGHCYLWIPSLLWLHVLSDFLIGTAYVGISLILYILVRKIRLPFSPVFIAFGLFIGLCGLTHFMNIWTVWNPDYWVDGWLKAGTAAASVATAIGLFFVKPQVEAVVHSARLSEERRTRLESAHAELEALYRKVKELDELKTQFFANVSHELRTPLALILGPAERMLGDDNLTAQQRSQLEGISRNSKSLLKQVNDLLDVSRLEAGKMQLHYMRFDIAAWLRRVASQFEVAAEEKRIRYLVSVPDTFTAECDPEILERIVMNLLSNAFKFTPLGGAIHVELRKGHEEFFLSVSDSGPGIPAGQREAVFERFRQVDGGATRQYGGTGLGLAIVKECVELHDGTVEVTTAPEGGAMFIVEVPLAAPPEKTVVRAEEISLPATEAAVESVLQQLPAHARGAKQEQGAAHFPDGATVLVVEDNPEMNNFVAGTLNTQYNVVKAFDGQEGLDRAAALRPDLIVTDIMMPRMSGDQLVLALRREERFDSTPILLLTAKADDDLRVRLLQSGAQDYLTKPFLPEELLARAGNLIAAKRAGDVLRSELSSASGDVEALAREISAKHHQLRIVLETTEVAREQAETASRAKSEFLALVSHEMRTPLATIQMNLELLGSQTAEQPSDAVIARIGRLNRATHQIFSLIESLLEYTRLQSGRVQIHTASIDVIALAREVWEAHADIAPPGVDFRFDPPDAPAPELISDVRLLRVALSNLVSNALKFTRRGSVVLRPSWEGGHHVFEVEDTGIGIPEADLSRIFLPFEQLEPVKRKSIPGVGLGLALVKQIVEDLGGNLDVTSVLGSGSMFRIRIPNGNPVFPTDTSILKEGR